MCPLPGSTSEHALSSVEPSEPDRASVLDVRWIEGAPRGEALGLLEAARRVDSDMRFAGPPSGDATAQTATVEVRTQLFRHAVTAPDPERLAAVATFELHEHGVAVAAIVVAPEYRSLGLATAMCEELDLDRLESISSTTPRLRVVVACAFGSHPAAMRLASRFGHAPAAMRDWLLLPTRAAFDSSRLAQHARREVTVSESTERARRYSYWHAVPGHAVDHCSVVSVTGAAGLIGDALISWHAREPSPRFGVVLDLEPATGSAAPARQELVRAVVEWMWNNGATSIEAAVDALDRTSLRAFRAAAFQHDRTDTLYVNTR